MRNLEICKKVLELGEDHRLTVVYYVTIDDVSDSSSGVFFESYGIGVCICESGESAIIRGITQSAASIFALAALLAENTVTPVTTEDIVSDWFG